MLQQWRLIKDGPGDPAWNMAVDEALVHVHNEQSSLPILRLYTWSPPALSLGYFQKTGGIRFDELKRLGIVPVRRITGGRAVLHLGDLTYSIIISSASEIPVGVSASYRYLCRGLLAAFSMLGIEADPGSERSSMGGPDACFALSTGADVVFNGRKFVGSAQKRIGSSILQHGSILLSPQVEILNSIFENGETRSNEMLGQKITCLENILGHSIDAEEVAHAVAEGFAQVLEIELLPDCLTDDEVKTAHSLTDKYRPISVKGLPLNN
ncbi:MAG: biotin/lipoate A/B protein ligase family protein [Proteobacteria bacterium]|nr:biotin/lipoate A/B protein ligase family protein [Pseudomonadota bacterium]